ncbi:polysaccharide biosynthesis protein [Sagittula sp. SSi028]|uniref:polysaccharide biosynthesis protein n=1 Tax=Sagittula sp. SSi028 TaxID=3400636 RepID=UPI003AF8899C
MLFALVTGLRLWQKHMLFAALDVLVVWLSVAVSLTLFWPFIQSDVPPSQLVSLCVALGGIAAGLGWAMGLTRIKLEGYELRATARTALYAFSLGGATVLLSPYLDLHVPLGVVFTMALLVLVMSAAWRAALRHITRRIYMRGGDTTRILIYGAGSTGQQFATALRHHDSIDAIALIDDNPTLQSQIIAGLRVYAPSTIPRLVADRHVDRIVLAMPSQTPADLMRVRHRLRDVGCEIHQLPSLAALLGDGSEARPPQAATIDHLLGRGQIAQDSPGLRNAYQGRTVLVTGAGGSIGSELCRQVATFEPAHLILLDHSELALYGVDKELRLQFPQLPITPVLGSVLNEQLIHDTLHAHPVDVVLHAAAYKHLPLVESNPLTGLKNNVLGTKTMADAARSFGVDRFILVSSDKAVRPTNVMGASKRLAELLVQDLANRQTDTRFSMVRFGNVLGSSGSVIPLFEEQIARGGPITLTDPQVTRYFMTIPEAARLVLMAGSFARGGDVFVLDMGEPMSIKTLAQQMIEGAGLTVRDDTRPDGDIEIQVTGLRPGEKLHEELLISADMMTTHHPKIFRAQEACLTEFETATALRELRQAIDTGDEIAARAVIARWVEHPTQTDEAMNAS